MFSLIEAALIVATLVVQSTAMAISSDQLTNNTATTIAVGDLLKLDLTRGRRNDKFQCVQIFVEYSEPADAKDPSMYLSTGLIAGGNTQQVESSLSLTPGIFTVHVKADVVEISNPNGCSNLDRTIEAEFEGTTAPIDFYVPTAQNILVVLLKTGGELTLGGDIPDALFSKLYAPIFTQFEGCPSVLVGGNCDHDIKVSTLNPSRGEVPNNPVAGQYYVQFDHVQRIEVASATYKFFGDVNDLTWDPSSDDLVDSQLRDFFFSAGNGEHGEPTALDAATLAGGLGYVTATGVATTSQIGTALTVDIVADGGAVTAVTINNPGYGYDVGTQITIDGGNGGASIAVASVNTVAYIDHSIPNTDANSIFGSQSDGSYDGGRKDFSYRTYPFLNANTYRVPTSATSPFQTERSWSDLKISPKNLVLLYDTTWDTGADGLGTLPMKVTLDIITNTQTAPATTVQKPGVLFKCEDSPAKNCILHEYVADESGRGDINQIVYTTFGDTTTTTLSVVPSFTTKDVYPGTLDYSIKAYGNELDPSKANAFSDSNKIDGTSSYTANFHNCDVTAADPSSDIACMSSQISLSTSIVSSAEVRVGAIVAHSPNFDLAVTINDLVHVDSSLSPDTSGFGGIAYGETELNGNDDFKAKDLPRGGFKVKVKDQDLFTNAPEEYGTNGHDLRVVIAASEETVPMQSCGITCIYEDCPSIAVNDDFDVSDSDFTALVDSIATTYTDAEYGFQVTRNKAGHTIEFDFTWKPAFQCPVGETTCNDDDDNAANPRVFADFDKRLRYYGTTYCQYEFTATDNTANLNSEADNIDAIVDLSSGKLLVMIRAHPVSADYTTALASYAAPFVSFSVLAVAQIDSTADTRANYVRVEHANGRSMTESSPKLGLVTGDVNDCAGGSVDLGLKSGANNLCCTAGITSSVDYTTHTGQNGVNVGDSDSSKFTFVNNNLDLGNGFAFAGSGSTVAYTSGNEFFKLCFIIERNIFPYDEMAILLDNSLEVGNLRRSARQLDDDSAENVESSLSNQIFLDFSADGVLTVRIDDQLQPVISVESNDQVVPQKEVSTTSPQLEDENNTTEQITTTLLGLIIGAVLILLVIVVIAVMMLNKRKEAAAKVYPFWMPGTDVTKTTVQA